MSVAGYSCTDTRFNTLSIRVHTQGICSSKNIAEHSVKRHVIAVKHKGKAEQEIDVEVEHYPREICGASETDMDTSVDSRSESGSISSGMASTRTCCPATEASVPMGWVGAALEFPIAFGLHVLGVCFTLLCRA